MLLGVVEKRNNKDFNLLGFQQIKKAERNRLNQLNKK